MDELKECPDCKSELQKQLTVKLKGNNVKAIGSHQFCVNMDCNFEIDL